MTSLLVSEKLGINESAVGIDLVKLAIIYLL